MYEQLPVKVVQMGLAAWCWGNTGGEKHRAINWSRLNCPILSWLFYSSLTSSKCENCRPCEVPWDSCKQKVFDETNGLLGLSHAGIPTQRRSGRAAAKIKNKSSQNSYSNPAWKAHLKASGLTFPSPAPCLYSSYTLQDVSRKCENPWFTSA